MARGPETLVALALLAVTSAPGRAAPGATHAEAIAPVIEGARTRRVDVVCIGDSNQLYYTHGWDHGWGRALSLRHGMYASGLVSAGENAGNGQGMGFGYEMFPTLQTGDFVYAGAPDFHDQFLNSASGMGPLAYAHVRSGHTASTNYNLGLIVDRWSPLDVNASLRFSLVYGAFEGPAASFTPLVRLQDPPYSYLVVGPTLTSSGPEPEIRTARIDLPRAARNSSLNYRFAAWPEPLVGPFILYYLRAENTERAAGAALHTLHGVGGQSARDMAAALQGATMEHLSLYFSLARELQPEPRRLLVRINSGLNDRGEKEPSVGPNPQLPGWSNAAFADNLQAIINRVREVWAANLWDDSELHFLLTVSHPTGDGTDWQLDGFRAAAEQVASANQRTATARLDELTTPAEMLANGWYQDGGLDRAHLTAAAFEELSRRELMALLPPERWADVNANGVVDFADLIIVLGNYGVANIGPQAPTNSAGDIDADGDVDFADLALVLAHFGAGR